MKSFLIAGLMGLAIVSTCFVKPPASPEAEVKEYFLHSFKAFVTSLENFKSAAESHASQATLREKFRACRSTYKKVEALLEYYYDLDAPKFNGPAIDFIEEEDPNAYHQPQGLQVIESYLYPYDTAKRKELLASAEQLLELSKSMYENTLPNFEAQGHVLEALMEETYRIIALGITGFDTPGSLNGLAESSAALEGIGDMLNAYRTGRNAQTALRQQRLIKEARQYLSSHPGFDAFDRMFFIRNFMNPLSESIAGLRKSMQQSDNPFHYSLISKQSHLFAEGSFRRDAYLFDDTLTGPRVELGRKLFNEPRLSSTGKRSCASCHQQQKAFTDGMRKAFELEAHTLLPRNTPTLLNAAFQHNLFYDSRQVSLDQLINEVLGNSREMHSGPDSAMANLQNDPDYQLLYHKAYPFERGKIRARFAVNAISMYLRTLVSYNSRFDQYVRGKEAALSKREIAGYNLFAGKARCATCHFIPLFNGSKPPTYFYQESEVLGVPSTNDTLHAKPDEDPGRFQRLPLDFLKGAFKIPTLRNIALTAPYMHNGVFPDLNAVLDFYNRGGGRGLHLDINNQTLSPEPLFLTPMEKQNIILFLGALTDTSSYKKPHLN